MKSPLARTAGPAASDGGAPRAAPTRLGPAWTPVLAPLVALAVLLAVIPAEGGFSTGTWCLLGLFFLAMLALVLTLGAPDPGERSKPVALALALYAAFTAWALLSMTWAAVPALAWEGADRILLHGLVLALVCLRPWRRRAGELALALVAGATTLSAAIVLADTAIDSRPAASFLQGRLADPLAYPNATANLYLVGLWPALHFATRPGSHWAIRGLALAAAGLLTQGALLSQSRGAAVAFAVAGIVVLALAPRRWASLLGLAAVTAMAALGFGTLTDVRAAQTVPELESALGAAREWVLLSVAVLAALGVAAGLAGSRLPRAMRTRGARRAGDAAIAALAVAALAAALVAIGDPGRWLDDRWRDFKTTDYAQVESGRTRFTGSLGSNRYDFWRVSWDQFRDHPVRGIGVDNFQPAYLRERRSTEAPRYAHSLPFSVLSGLGAVGALLLLGAVALLVAAAVARRRAGPAEAAVVVAALGSFSAFGAHALVDWLWEFPTLAGVALAMLGIAARTVPDDARAPGSAVAPPPRHGRSTLVAAGALAGVLAFAGPGASSRFVASATRAETPEQSLRWLDRAAAANPLSAEPLLAEGVFARRQGDLGRARDALQEALRRERGNWFGHFELALVLAEAGDRASARRSAAEAARVNPGQPVIAELQQDLRARKPIQAARYEAALSEQLAVRLRPLDAP